MGLNIGSYLRFDISIFAIIMLVALLITINFRNEVVNTSGRLLRRIVVITAFMLAFEILSWQFDCKQGVFNWYANYIANMIYCLLIILVMCAWICYVDYQIFKSYARIKKRCFYLYPFFVNVILIVINFFTPIIFTVSEANVYLRGPYVWLLELVAVSAYFYSIILAFKNTDRIRRKIMKRLLVFFFIPLTAGTIQVFVYGVFVLWPAMAGTVIMTYIFLETVSNSQDYLTGLISRHRLDDYVEYLLENKKEFVLTVIDLNRFKSINDIYGHLNGDRALVVFADSISQVFKDVKMIARYAGDEFVIVSRALSYTQLESKFELLTDVLQANTKKAGLEFAIEFSYGYEKNEVDSNNDYKTIFNAADNNMYNDKEKTR